MRRSIPTRPRRGTLTLAAPLLALSFVAAAQAQGVEQFSVPFKASLTIEETVVFTGALPCFAFGSVTARGNASHLGTVTASSQDCISPLGAFDPAGSNSFSFASVRGESGLILTAANGDRVFAHYSGTLTAQDGRHPHRIAGHFVIAGGTGRFSGVTGGGTLDGEEDISQIVSGHGNITLNGVIRY